MQGKGVAITRPSDQAKTLCNLITAAGGTPILFPLIEIVPPTDYSVFEKVISGIADYDWVIFISSNAVQNGLPKLVKQGLPAHLRFAAIGPVTAQELNKGGIANVLIPQNRFDSEALLALPEMQSVRGQKVLIVRGVGGRELLAETLISRGANVTFAECYQRINPQQNANKLAQLYAEHKLDGIVVTSSEAMRHLLDLAGQSDWLKHTPIFVNHARVAEPARALGLSTYIADTAGDEAMCTLLSTTLSGSDSQR